MIINSDKKKKFPSGQNVIMAGCQDPMWLLLNILYMIMYMTFVPYKSFFETNLVHKRQSDKDSKALTNATTVQM